MFNSLKPFYRGAKTTVVGAISLKKVVGIMTLDGSMDGKAFSVFIEHFLVPNWVFWVCGVNCIIYELYARG